jgi:hypothetical protein
MTFQWRHRNTLYGLTYAGPHSSSASMLISALSMSALRICSRRSSSLRNRASSSSWRIHNRERLNRRLMLMQLDLTGKARQGEYAKIIREELLKNAGFGGPRYAKPLWGTN